MGGKATFLYPDGTTPGGHSGHVDIIITILSYYYCKFDMNPLIHCIKPYMGSMLKCNMSNHTKSKTPHFLLRGANAMLQISLSWGDTHAYQIWCVHDTICWEQDSMSFGGAIESLGHTQDQASVPE